MRIMLSLTFAYDRVKTIAAAHYERECDGRNIESFDLPSLFLPTSEGRHGLFLSRRLSPQFHGPGTHRNAFSWVTDRGGPRPSCIPHTRCGSHYSSDIEKSMVVKWLGTRGLHTDISYLALGVAEALEMLRS